MKWQLQPRQQVQPIWTVGIFSIWVSQHQARKESWKVGEDQKALLNYSLLKNTIRISLIYILNVLEL